MWAFNFKKKFNGASDVLFALAGWKKKIDDMLSRNPKIQPLA
jgi:hypothetical protein